MATTPGSEASIIFGKGYHFRQPGSIDRLVLAVSDIEAARASSSRTCVEGEARSSTVQILKCRSYASYAAFSDPDGNAWLLQEITTRLLGRIDPAATTFDSASDLAPSACSGRPRRAREAPRQGRPELVRLLRRVHGR